MPGVAHEKALPLGTWIWWQQGCIKIVGDGIFCVCLRLNWGRAQSCCTKVHKRRDTARNQDHAGSSVVAFFQCRKIHYRKTTAIAVQDRYSYNTRNYSYCSFFCFCARRDVLLRVKRTKHYTLPNKRNLWGNITYLLQTWLPCFLNANFMISFQDTETKTRVAH